MMTLYHFVQKNQLRLRMRHVIIKRMTVLSQKGLKLMRKQSIIKIVKEGLG